MKNIIVEENYKDNQYVALIRLNRPKVLNALSTELMRELVDSLKQLEAQKVTRVVILTGSERAFSAGADISQMVAATPIDQINDNRFSTWHELSLISLPLIAAVNGPALGGGCELMMNCDMAIAGDSARFGQPEIKIGTTPGAGGTQRLTKAIGKAKAMYMVLTGEMISAKQAYDWGLVTKVVSDNCVIDEAYQIACSVADKAPVAVKLAKESVKKSFDMGLTDGLDFERRNFYLTFASKDQKIGMQAFLDKKPAQYNGN